MNITDEILGAYLDGELTVDDIAQVAAQIEKSPELSKRIENMRRNDASLARTYHAIDTKPMPDSIMAILEDFPQNQKSAKQNTVLPFKKKPSVHTSSPLWQMAIAATIALFIGLGAGHSLLPPSSIAGKNADTVIAQQNSGIIGPDNILFPVLENQPSATPVILAANDETVVIPSMTFRTADNIYCREYSVMARKSSTQNVACRIENTWIVKLSVGSVGKPPSEDGLYQTASHQDNPAITSVIQNLIIGDALNAEDEIRVMKQKWQ